MRRANSQLPLIDLPADRTPPLRLVADASPSLPSASLRRRRPQAWLALRFNELPLMAARPRGAEIKEAVAVVDDDRQRRVLACNCAAARSGIRPGQTFNAAIAINAEVQLLDRDPEREREILLDLAIFCNHYSPVVTIASDDELLVEARGSLRLFGGVNAFVARVREDLAQRGWRPQIALTPTIWASLWSARCARIDQPTIAKPKELVNTLARLPIAALAWPYAVAQRLQRFGATTVGDLLRLPRDGLAKRIGMEHLLQLDQARGRAPIVRETVKAPLTYADHMHLDFEVETAELLERLLEPRLEKLQWFLRNHARAVREVEIRLAHREMPVTSLVVALASATSDIARLRRVLKEKLASHQLVAPVRHVAIIVQRLESGVCDSESLLPNATGTTHSVDEARAALLEQLEIRLGQGSVRQPCHCADRRPDRAAASVRASVAPRATAVAVPSTIAPRPLWLLRTPEAWGTSSSFSVIRGPERIRGGWWDSHFVSRSYYVVRLRHGPMLWVFQDAASPSRWFLHGVFA